MLMYAPTINPTTFEKQHIWITCDIRKRMNGMVIATACRLCVSARHHQYIPNVCSCGFDIFTSQKCHQNFRFASEYPIGFCHGIGTSVYQHWVFWFGKSKETFEYDLQIKWKTCAASFLTLPQFNWKKQPFMWEGSYDCRIIYVIGVRKFKQSLHSSCMHFRNEKFMTIFQLKCYQTFQPVLKYAIMIVLSIELVNILTNIQNCFQFEKSAFLSHQSHLAIYTDPAIYTATYGFKIKINLTRITFKLTWRLRFYMPFVKSLYGNLSFVCIGFEVIKKMNCTNTWNSS